MKADSESNKGYILMELQIK